MAASKPKIFVVEDELITARHLRHRLSRLGYDVIGVAAGGLEALRKMGERQPDLLLADIGLPGEIDGIAVAAEARKRSQIPSVFLTAYTDPETMRRVQSCEPYDYLVKPFADQELHAAIEIAIQQRSLAERWKRQSQTASTILEHTREELAAVGTAHLGAGRRTGAHRPRPPRRYRAAPGCSGIRPRQVPPESALRLRVRSERICQAIHTRIGEIAADLRKVSHQLHPGVLDDLGLLAALRSLGHDFEQRHGTSCRVSSRNVPEHIPPSIALALYRIAQEALRNVSRHAGPAAVHISLVGGADCLDLGISDTGCGFHRERERKGLGLHQHGAAGRTRGWHTGSSNEKRSRNTNPGSHPADSQRCDGGCDARGPGGGPAGSA